MYKNIKLQTWFRYVIELNTSDCLSIKWEIILHRFSCCFNKDSNVAMMGCSHAGLNLTQSLWMGIWQRHQLCVRPPMIERSPAGAEIGSHFTCFLCIKEQLHSLDSRRPCSGLLAEQWFNVLMKLFHSCMFTYSLYSCENKYWPSLRDYLFKIIFILPRNRAEMWWDATVSVDRHAYIYALSLFYCVCMIFHMNTHAQVQSKFCIKALWAYCLYRPVSYWCISNCLCDICWDVPPLSPWVGDYIWSEFMSSSVQRPSLQLLSVRKHLYLMPVCSKVEETQKKDVRDTLTVQSFKKKLFYIEKS